MPTAEGKVLEDAAAKERAEGDIVVLVTVCYAVPVSGRKSVATAARVPFLPLPQLAVAGPEE